MLVPLRKAAMLGLILAMVAGFTAVSTIMFDRRFDLHPAARLEAAPVPVAAGAVDRVSGAGLGRAISRLQVHLRAQPKDAAGWSTLGLAYVEQARLTADPSHYPKAEGVLRRSLQVKPGDNEPALTGQAALAAARHDFAGALRQADDALKINPYATRAHAVRVDALVELGRYDTAWDAVRHADSVRPGIPIATRYAYLLELRGKPGEARKVLERAAETAADRTDAAYLATRLGDLAWNRGDLRAAGTHFGTALRADSTYIEALDGRARVRAAQGDLGRALADRTALTARVPLPSYVVALGQLYESRGRKQAAREQYAVVGAWQNLARANGVATDLESALIAADHGDAATALRSAEAEWARRRSIHVADVLSWALHVSGRDREALAYSRQAARTGFRDALFLYHRGMIEKALGRDDDARRSLSAALKLNPDFSVLHAPRARRALESLS